MTHIEFLGPPGAGKSSIYSQLVNSKKWYGGVDDGAVGRTLATEYELKYQILYQMLPSRICGLLEREFLQYRLGHDALEEFVREHPNFIEELVFFMNSVSYEPEKVFSTCRRSAEQYQLGISTVSEQEKLCIDEGFAQRAFSILWRQPDETFSLEKYFETVPVPKLVIHVDAPVDLCLKRQRERGRISIAREWGSDDIETTQRRSRDICRTVADNLPNKTSVVTIKNTNTIQQAVNQISSNLMNIEQIN